MTSGNKDEKTEDPYEQENPNHRPQEKRPAHMKGSRGLKKEKGQAGASSSTGSSISDGSSASSLTPDSTEVQRSIGIDLRRRDPRVSGSDLYVARVKKTGMGNAMPCWRCLEWCRWAGVKRVFHWSGDEERWLVIKVNDLAGQCYQTRADYEHVS